MFFRGYAHGRILLKHRRVGEAVADVYVGEQIDRGGRIVLDLLAQLTHEGAQIFHLFAAIRAPHRTEQARVGYNAAGADHEAMQDVELLAGEMNLLAAPGDVTLDRVETNLADLNRRVFGANGRLDAADGRAHTRNQFARAERLGDVIVGAQVERLYLFFFLVAHCQHENRQARRGGANAAQRLHAADARHVHVEKHRIERRRSEQLQRLFAARGFGHLEPEFRERRPQRPADCGLVVDHKNANGLRVHYFFLFSTGAGMAAKNVVPSTSSLVTHT